MDFDALMSRYDNLRQELSIAYTAQPWESSRINRLADDLSLAEREIASRQYGRRESSNVSASA